MIENLGHLHLGDVAHVAGGHEDQRQEPGDREGRGRAQPRPQQGEQRAEARRSRGALQRRAHRVAAELLDDAHGRHAFRVDG